MTEPHQFRDLDEQRWPAPTALEIECFNLFGDERAKTLVSRARKDAQRKGVSFDEALAALISKELSWPK